MKVGNVYINLVFRLRSFWVGAHYSSSYKSWYIAPFPCFVIRVGLTPYKHDPGLLEHLLYNRRTVWTTYDGIKVAIKDMADTHLANLIMFLTVYSHPARPMRAALIKEGLRRGLSDNFLAGGPYPYRDATGEIVIWDYELHQPVPFRESV